MIGPPGTGKTSTIIGMLSALLQTPLCISPDQQTESASSRRILVCAPSNTAIDEVVGRLATQGIIANQPGESKRNGSRDVPRMQVNIVRLGDTQQADAAVQATVLDEQVEQRVRKDALYLQHVRLNDSIAEQENRLHELGVRRQTVTSTFISSHVDTEQQGVAKKKTEYEKCKDAIQELCRQRTQCERALDRLRLDTRHDVLQSADIICTTLSSSNKQHFLDYVLKEQISFNTVIIDEAAQTTEISTLIPLRLGCRHLVLIGDPRQLPATVLSRAAQAGGLGRSLFERLESLEHEVVMLTTQYRMHPGKKYVYVGIACNVTYSTHMLFHFISCRNSSISIRLFLPRSTSRCGYCARRSARQLPNASAAVQG
ncbi:hypothetical protein EON65_25770 [archaeon]|nr:MAG: hypothetical protein EON65_25770 [archaeon]